jgi:hypothetical protein
MVVKASVSFLTSDSDAVLNTDVSKIITSLKTR